ncbi:hypothetical protein C8R44DRAFT_54759 [Mycena epipterygia]|nr:hypothetical protein C8R44DRAFT_54759 [Mycena epipterygia]
MSERAHRVPSTVVCIERAQPQSSIVCARYPRQRGTLTQMAQEARSGVRYPTTRLPRARSPARIRSTSAPDPGGTGKRAAGTRLTPPQAPAATAPPGSEARLLPIQAARELAAGTRLSSPQAPATKASARIRGTSAPDSGGGCGDHGMTGGTGSWGLGDLGSGGVLEDWIGCWVRRQGLLGSLSWECAGMHGERSSELRREMMRRLCEVW